MKHLPPKYITVHAAATYPSMDTDVEDVRQWHLHRGWSDIGYNFFIKRDGTLQEGRPIHRVGAHVGGNNTGNLSICMAGGLKEGTDNTPEDNFTKEQFTTLTKKLVEMINEYQGVELMGHNDFDGYEDRGCPCFNQHVYFKWLRSSMKALYKPDDWYDQSKFDWHSFSPDAWKVPEQFMDAVQLKKRVKNER